MMDAVFATVAENSPPTEDDDGMILLSAHTPAHMKAVRASAGRYLPEKSIVLVNCQLSPVPRELMGGSTVYHILPLVVAKKSQTSEPICSVGIKNKKN